MASSVDQDGGREVEPAMDDAMADGGNARLRELLSSTVRTVLRAPGWSATKRSPSRVSLWIRAPLPFFMVRFGSVPRPSIWPMATHSRAPAANSANFSDEEPALIVRIWSDIAVAIPLLAKGRRP